MLVNVRVETSVREGQGVRLLWSVSGGTAGLQCGRPALVNVRRDGHLGVLMPALVTVMAVANGGEREDGRPHCEGEARVGECEGGRPRWRT